MRKRIEVWGVSKNRGDNNRSGSLCDLFFDQINIEIQSVHLNINEDRNQIVLDDWRDCCWEANRRNNELISIFPTQMLLQCREHNKVCGGTRIHHLTCCNIEHLTETCLELINMLTCRDPFSSEQCLQCIFHLLMVKVWTCVLYLRFSRNESFAGINILRESNIICINNHSTDKPLNLEYLSLYLSSSLPKEFIGLSFCPESAIYPSCFTSYSFILDLSTPTMNLLLSVRSVKRFFNCFIIICFISSNSS